MGELRLYHPSLKVSSITALPKSDFVIISDSMQDVILLQSETKMKAALGQKVKVSLPEGPVSIYARGGMGHHIFEIMKGWAM